MRKYIVLYYAPIDAMSQTENASKAELEEGMKPWLQWQERCGDALLDMGTPLLQGVDLKPGGGSAASIKSIVGYSVMQAASPEDMSELLMDHPHLGWNEEAEISFHESIPLPGL